MNKAIPWALVAANLVGIFFYLRNAALAWALPEEAGLDPAIGGDAMVWGVGALPILLLFLLADGIWWHFTERLNLSRWPAWTSFAFWVTAVVVDFRHH